MKKFEIINKGNRVAEILFYGYIGFWGTNSSKNLSVQLRDLDKQNDTIIIRMNSGGGSVVEAAAIYNTIKSLKAETVIIVEGIAASAASFILLAADKVQMGKASRIMLHKFSGSAFGNSDDLRETANMMDDWENDWIDIYAEKMKLSSEDVKTKYFQRGKDVWIGAKDAKKLNLINEIIDGVVKEEPTDVDNLSPAYAEASYQNKIQNKNQNTDSMNKETLAAMGLPENATQEQIDARLKVLTAAEKTLKDNPIIKAEPITAVLESVEDPEKVELKAQLAKIQTDNREKILTDAIDSGKILASSKDDWNSVGSKLGNEELSKMISGLSPAAKPNDKIKPTTPGATSDFEKLEDLYTEGEAAVEAYQKENPDKFNALWKASYGSDYSED